MGDYEIIGLIVRPTSSGGDDALGLGCCIVMVLAVCGWGYNKCTNPSTIAGSPTTEVRSYASPYTPPAPSSQNVAPTRSAPVQTPRTQSVRHRRRR